MYMAPGSPGTEKVFASLSRQPVYREVPSQPLTLNRFSQKWPFLHEPAIFRIGDPFHSISYPQNPLGGTHFRGRHGHGLEAIHRKQSPKFPKKKGNFGPFFTFISPLKITPEASRWAWNLQELVLFLFISKSSGCANSNLTLLYFFCTHQIVTNFSQS